VTTAARPVTRDCGAADRMGRTAGLLTTESDWRVRNRCPTVDA